ncbi:unnamed protein product [Caenorhabditis bovis]|uniref:Uncharacterized protein n=1 Tax=Caenorhabditis bovis TaxID=2654633 RepID=A0A8S1F6K7_9PELO|nr:unnamed protein product [Caenorhabditis bovis]
MVYVDKSGNITDKKQKGIIEMITGFFMFIWLFIQSFLGLSTRPNGYTPTAIDHRQALRHRGGGGGGGIGYRPGDNQGFRRNIGRLPDSSGIAPPPMGGGCCGGGGCG